MEAPSLHYIKSVLGIFENICDIVVEEVNSRDYVCFTGSGGCQGEESEGQQELLQEPEGQTQQR